MKVNFLLTTILTLAIVTTISSCSTSYKTGQTPDDVYYSPARLQTDNVRREKEENNNTVYDNSVYSTPEDLEIRRRVHNRRYRRYQDRYDNPYGYNGAVYGNPKSGTTTTTAPEARKTNLGGYTQNNTTADSTRSTNIKLGGRSNSNTSSNGTNPSRTFGNPGSSSNNRTGTTVGNIIREIFSGDNSSNSNNSSPSRIFGGSSNNNNSSNNSSSNSSNSGSRSSSSTSSSSSSSSSSGGSSSAPVRTFKNN